MNHLFYSDECSSTNDEIHQFLLYPEADFIGLYTFNQKSGRGQYGNTWKSLPDENIAYSVAVKKDLISVPDLMFNYCTAIVFRNCIANVTQNQVSVKWPNDLIINHKKVAGILIEKKKVNGEWYFIVGIGVNVLQKDYTEFPQAGSLYTQTRQIFELKTLIQNLHQSFISFILNFKNENEILKEFNENLYRKDEISVFEIGGVRQNGIIRKALPTGELLIELEDGERKFYHKEIKLLY
ncbi:hypothetical protein ASG01_06115 [Chryseobacterium sp. Leaf180]|uniref:biotin--[acetyl-CoA-carboxylase] ligase n=1 Tax=Chryseobacterium sp. Leaf180 TaxID=1736289 RepID=UPI0006F2D580|nr:biotin--[acetyl-CoA-carboxylase] ligase [Chryseobacterium sp. Leaf180]KQR95416.1 hypothetical protein ASG01_06115 [Chryseobacterium sp. Leaf180]